MSLDAIGIISQDILKSIKFYGMLGIEFKALGGDEHFEGETPGGVRVMLDSVKLMKSLNPDWQKPVGCGVILCFKQGSPNKVNEVYAGITKEGYKSVKPPWDAFWGQRYASVQDPDGNQIDLFAAL